MATNSVRMRLLTTVPHLHFPLGFAHLGDEKPAHWLTVRFKDGVAHDIHSEQIQPTMRGMIGGEVRRLMRIRKLAEVHPSILDMPREDQDAVLRQLDWGNA